MILRDGQKWACRSCITGHRSSKCVHEERELFPIAKKGRPSTASKCKTCRDQHGGQKATGACKCQPRRRTKNKSSSPNSIENHALEPLLHDSSRKRKRTHDCDGRPCLKAELGHNQLRSPHLPSLQYASSSSSTASTPAMTSCADGQLHTPVLSQLSPLASSHYPNPPYHTALLRPSMTMDSPASTPGQSQSTPGSFWQDGYSSAQSNPSSLPAVSPQLPHSYPSAHHPYYSEYQPYDGQPAAIPTAVQPNGGYLAYSWANEANPHSQYRPASSNFDSSSYPDSASQAGKSAGSTMSFDSYYNSSNSASPLQNQFSQSTPNVNQQAYNQAHASQWQENCSACVQPTGWRQQDKVKEIQFKDATYKDHSYPQGGATKLDFHNLTTSLPATIWDGNRQTPSNAVLGSAAASHLTQLLTNPVGLAGPTGGQYGHGFPTTDIHLRLPTPKRGTT